MAASRAAGPLKNFIQRSLLNPLRMKSLVKPIEKWQVLIGDSVVINTGRDRGKTGKVKHVLRSRNRVVVEGLNLVRKHIRPTEGKAGGVIPVEAAVHYSNVNLVDPSSG
jgi:large subunit ribosomal protein L24